MAGLLDVATLLTGDGSWMHGYEVDALACGREFDIVDICTPGPPPDADDSLTGYKVVPFALVSQQRFGARCAPEDAWSSLVDATDSATENMVADVFYNGDNAINSVNPWDGEMWLESTDVNVVTAGTDTAETVGKVLIESSDNNPELTEPILHLGVQSAIHLGAGLANLDIEDIVVSPAYPADAVAVTGPVLVRISDIQSLITHQESTNRRYYEATRLAVVEFDPCLATRAATT